jgi:hypothetical protein
MEQLNTFKEKGYCVVKSAIDSDLRDFITQYALFDEMRNFESDIQVSGAHAKYADPAMETFLLKLLPLMEKHTGLKLSPTYSYYRVYRPGDELTPHKDRPSCEISCTLCFNYSYSDYSWPIFMDSTRVDQLPGDLVIYRGCDLLHWREKFNIEDQTAWHVQGFFHYVDKNGPFPEYEFDQRESLGLPKTLSKTLPLKKEYIKYL